MDETPRVSIPDNALPMVRDIKNVTLRHSNDEIYQVLVECNMDTTETIERLLYLDSFKEVKSKRDRKKGRGEGSRSPGQMAKGVQRGEGSRSPGQMAKGVRGNYSHRSRGVTGGRSSTPRREIMLNEFIEKIPEISPTEPVKICRQISSPNNNKNASVGEPGNASNREDVHEQEPQKPAEVASKNSKEMIVKVTPESVNGQAVSALDLQLAKINVNALQTVIFPIRLQLLDAFKGGLTFGTMDIAYEKSFARILETQVMLVATHVSDQESCAIPREGDNLVHHESPRPVPQIASLQKGVSVDEGMKYEQPIGRELMRSVPKTKSGSSQASSSPPNNCQAAAVDVPQSSLHVPQPPPPNYEHGPPLVTKYYQSHPYFYPYNNMPSSMHQYVRATPGFYQRPSTANMYPSSPVSGYGFSTSPQVNSGGDNETYTLYNQLVYPSAQADQIQYAYPAMQQTPPQAGTDTYHYPAMQQVPTHADLNAYYYPAMQQVLTHAHPNAYHYPAMQQVPTQADYATYYYPAIQAPQDGHDPAHLHPAMQAHQAGHDSTYSHPHQQQ